MVVHNNQVYGLTKGQASPTSHEGFVTKAQPKGVASASFNPIAIAVAMKAGFVARGFAGRADHLADLIQQGIAHRGLSVIDVLQPCVSFNKLNTFSWYEKRCHPLPDDFDITDWEAASKVASQWGDKIPIGVIYKNNRRTFEDHFPAFTQGPLFMRDVVDRGVIEKIMEKYG